MKKNTTGVIFPLSLSAGVHRRLQAVLILTMLFPYIAMSYGQDILQRQVSVELREVPLETALEKISASSGVRIGYSGGVVTPSAKVSLTTRKEPLGQVLAKVLTPHRLVYSVIGNSVILRPASIPKAKVGKPETSADTLRIGGRVADENGEALPGVNVQIKGTAKGTITEADGSFHLDAREPGEVLVFSFVGYEAKEVRLAGKSFINVELRPSASRLDEIVVVGYGIVKKSDLTGSVATISGKEVSAFPVPGLVMGLQGKSTGVQVTQNSGAPGGTISVRIRGGNSLVGNNEPLYVIDGFALTGAPDALNPQDIESVEILKDASSAAIYGSRGANGVVLITTKRGKEGRSEISAETYWSVQQLRKKIKLANAREFAELANERAANDGLAPYFTPDEINNFGEGTDWQDVLYRTAPLQNHTLNANGSKGNTSYSVSGSYLGQEGILRGSDLNRASLRSNIQVNLSSKVRLTYHALLTHTNTSRINSDNGSKGSTVVNGLLGAPPTIAPFDESGKYSDLQAYSFSPNNLINPLALALERSQKAKENYVVAGTSVSYEPVKDLVFKVSGGIESSSSREDVYSPSIIYTTPNGQARISSWNSLNILNENLVTYSKTFSDAHQLTLLGGFTYQQNSSRYFSTGNATGFSTDELRTGNIQSASVPGTPESSSSRWYLLSYLGRANYNFRDRYLVTASIRSDGSSRFGEGNKWGYFPSAAVAWRAINEHFLRDQALISDLKLRASWGITGSTALNPYQTINSLNSYKSIFNDALYIGYAPSTSGYANPNLKWETTEQTDIGLDLGVWKNRLLVTFDVYRKDTRDLLANIPLPTSSGFSTTLRNIGKIRNSGVELGINAVVTEGPVRWDVGLNVSRNRNKVVALTGDRDEIFGVQMPQPLEASVNLVRVGQPVGVFYGYLEDGLKEDGTIRYKDLDGTPGITTSDRTIIGNPNPKMIYNFSSSLVFRQLEFAVQLQGVQGVSIFNQNLAAQANSFWWGENQLKALYDNHWSASNPDPKARYPKISSKNTYLPSDRFVEDGSFLRLRNIQLTYTVPFPSAIAKTIRLVQVYASGQNLLTFTKYSGYDPEVSTRGGATSISPGIDQSGYPNTRSYTFGLRLKL